MTTLAEHIIVAGAENRPPMLEKTMYDSWASRIRLFIKGKKNGSMMLDSIDKGPLFYPPVVGEDGQTRPKKYSKLTEAQQLQDDCDVQATNIILHGLPPDVYSLLINEMHTIGMTMQQVQVNTKFLNALPPEWSKFVTDVKLAKSFTLPTMISYFDLAVLTFQQGEDSIDCINKAMTFLSAVASRFPPSNNQLRTSSNPRNQATIQDGRVTVQQVQGRQTESFAGTGNKRIATNSKGNYAEGQVRVVKCYNYQGERHMARQCTQPKRPRNYAWFKEKMSLTKDLDAYDSDCYDISSAKAVLMANLSSCDLDVKSEVPYSDTYLNDMINQDVQEMSSADLNHLYDGSVIAKKHDVISVIDDEETLILEEESRSKMFDKQNDLISIKQKINISPIDYSKLNNLKEDFGKRFVIKKELSAEQAFWLKHSNSNSKTSIKSHTPVRIECPKELHKVSLVNESLKMLKYQLASFDKVVKKRTTSDAITVGAWGFEHTKACFLTEIIPFLMVLEDTFNAFDKTILDEITEVQTVFNQMEDAVDQCSVDKNTLEIQIKQLRINNDQLLNQIMSQEIVHIAVNSIDLLDVSKSCVDECNKCLELETELLIKKYMIEKDVYGKLFKSYSTLEKHCISLELATQLNQEIFQKDNSGENQNAPTFNQLFEINELKAHSQEKDTVIRKLKDRIKSLSGKYLNAQLQEKVFAIAALKNQLRKLKGKNVVDIAVSTPTATTLSLGMFKINLE
ncbi:hypothetical protein Tco_1345645 [Tanacetum coccineum]